MAQRSFPPAGDYFVLSRTENGVEGKKSCGILKNKVTEALNIRGKKDG
jgi:hypothetical protein